MAPLGPTRSLDTDAIQTALSVNVAAIIVLSRLVIPAMLTAGLGSDRQHLKRHRRSSRGDDGGNVYAASKAAIEASTINLAAELDGTGITVNAYRPGAVDTAMQAWIRAQSPDEIGHALHERFVTSHQSGDSSPPSTPPPGCWTGFPSIETGRLWNFSDQPANVGDQAAS